MRDGVGWLKALFPVTFFGFFLWYFWDASGSSMDDAVLMGVGPTVLGLSIVVLLSLIVPFVKLIRAVSGSNRMPRYASKLATTCPRPGASTPTPRSPVT